MKFRILTIFIMFFISSFISNILIGYISLFFILILVFIDSKRSLRLSGGIRFWIFPFLFFMIMSINFFDFKFEYDKLLFNFKIFFHLYVFSVILNFINDNLNLSMIYEFMDKYNFNKLKFILVFSLFVFKKMRNDMLDIIFFYRLNNKGIKFIKNLNMLFYVFIRNALRLCYDMVELLYLRGFYEKKS